jgi:NAD(P)H-dependent FMN reductase
MVYKIVAISGSLAKNSTNSGLIRACILVNNPDVQIEIVDISAFPLFNMDPII